MGGRVIAACVAVVLALVGTDGCGGGQAPDGGARIAGGDVPLIPAIDAEDWVSYADHVMVVTVTGEGEAPAEQRIPSGGGVITREVTLTTDSVLWSRPGFREAPTSFRAYAPGRITRDGARRPLKAGFSYVVAVYLMTGRGYAADEWMPFSVLPYQDGRIGDVEVVGGEPLARGILDEVAGRPASALAALLASTPPDPAGLRYPDLDGAARFQAVAAERRPTAPVR